MGRRWSAVLVAVAVIAGLGVSTAGAEPVGQEHEEATYGTDACAYWDIETDPPVADEDYYYYGDYVDLCVWSYGEGASYVYAARSICDATGERCDYSRFSTRALPGEVVFDDEAGTVDVALTRASCSIDASIATTGSAEEYQGWPWPDVRSPNLGRYEVGTSSWRDTWYDATAEGAVCDWVAESDGPATDAYLVTWGEQRDYVYVDLHELES